MNVTDEHHDRAEHGPSVSGFVELTLQTDDLAGLERFYCEVFDLRVLAREGDRVWLSVGTGARLGLWSPGKKEFGDQGGRHVHFAFSATRGQLEAVAERARSLGHSLTGPTEHEGGDCSIYLEDPAGNVVEVWDFFKSGDGAQQGVKALDSG